LRLARVAAAMAVLGGVVTAAEPALASTRDCGKGDGHTICVTAPSVLSGNVTVEVTNTPNFGAIVFRWDGGPLITRFGPSPQTHDYSFVWPTAKYPDGSGLLQASFLGDNVAHISVRLSNGGFQPSPDDWRTYLPPVWNGSSDPVVAAVGDGASSEPTSFNVVSSIVQRHPALFLYLGDVYEVGTYTENLSNYGTPNIGGGFGTQWGRFWRITQPTLGNHENARRAAWQDYWHQRPLWTSFRFGRVLFLDLDSSISMSAGSPQYRYVQGVLGRSGTPPCVVAFWHIPALSRGMITARSRQMWALLANHGGDLVLTGHQHTMAQYRALNDAFQLPRRGDPTMIQLIDGAGGHEADGPAPGEPRLLWTRGNTPGSIFLTLTGAKGRGTPSRLSWVFRNTAGSTLHTGSKVC